MANITISNLSETNKDENLQDIPHAKLTSIYGGISAADFIKLALWAFDNFDTVYGGWNSEGSGLVAWK